MATATVAGEPKQIPTFCNILSFWEVLDQQTGEAQRGDMALTDANPAFGPTEQGIMLEMSELDSFGAIWIDSDAFEKFRFSILAKPSSRAQKSAFWSSRN